MWETPPIGYTAQANFVHGAAIIETELSAREVKSQLLGRIENELKRVRTSNKNGPRTIDLDLVLFNEEILELAGQTIPDPDLLERAFIAVPMAEIAGDYIHPILGIQLDVLAARFEEEKAQMARREIAIDILQQ